MSLSDKKIIYPPAIGALLPPKSVYSLKPLKVIDNIDEITYYRDFIRRLAYDDV